MRVLIFEPGHKGHRLVYIKRLLPALSGLGVDVTVAVSRCALDSETYAANLRDWSTSVHIDAWMPLIVRRSPVELLAEQVSLLNKSIARSKCDHVYVPSGSGLSQLLGLAQTLGVSILRKGPEAEALMFSGRFAYPQSTRAMTLQARASIFAAVRSPWTRLHHLDPRAVQKLRQACSRPDKVRLMPDGVETPPTVTAAEARQRLGLPIEGRYVGCVGAIDHRKGAHLLVDAFRTARRAPGDRLLLAGPASAALREHVRRHAQHLVEAGDLITIDRYLSDEELMLAIAAIDVVGAVYPLPYLSSSIVIRAAAASRPVLASDQGWSGWIVPQFDLGWTCNAGSGPALAHALERALADAGQFIPSEAARRYVEFQSVENFTSAWTSRIRERLGLPSDLARTWEWAVSGTRTPLVS